MGMLLALLAFPSIMLASSQTCLQDTGIPGERHIFSCHKWGLRLCLGSKQHVSELSSHQILSMVSLLTIFHGK
jgi:hypothetical protein